MLHYSPTIEQINGVTETRSVLEHILLVFISLDWKETISIQLSSQWDLTLYTKAEITKCILRGR